MEYELYLNNIYLKNPNLEWFMRGSNRLQKK